MDPFFKRTAIVAWGICGVVGAIVLLTVLGPLAQRTVNSTVCKVQDSGYDHVYYTKDGYSYYSRN